MVNVDYKNLFGGVDSRSNYSQEDKKITFWEESKNVEVFGKAIRRMNGCFNVLDSDFSGQITAIGEHEIYGGFHSRLVTLEGKYYRFNEKNGSSAAVKTGLTTNSQSRPWITQFRDKCVVITGYDDPFLDDGTSITQTTLYDEKSVYGTCGAEFHGHLFIGSGRTLYWSAAGDPTDWTTSNDAGFDANFNGNILSIIPYSEYLVILTTQNIYLWSGYDNTTFQKVLFSRTGVQSKFAACKYEEKIYVFTQEGLFQLEQLGDMAQLNVREPLSFRIIDSLADDLDTGRMGDIRIVPYEQNKQIWCYIPIKNQSGLYRCWIANFANNKDSKVISFYPREGLAITAAGSLKGEIFTGTSTGKIYKENKGNDFDGTVIDWSVKLSFSLGKFSIIKYVEFLKLQASASVYNKFTLNKGFNEEFYKSTDIDYVVSSQYGIWDESNWDESYWASEFDRLTRTLGLHRRFTSIQLEFKGDEADDNIYLYGMTFINAKATNEI